MASNFKPWVNDTNRTNTLRPDEFVTIGDVGFEAGTKAVAKNVNTALRSTSAVTSALMEIVDPNGGVDYQDTIPNIKAQVETGLKAIKPTNAGTADNATNVNIVADEEAASDTIKFNIGTGIYNKTINNVNNAVNATNAANAVEAQYASSDHSKGTIEQRLTNLGFRQGSITFASGITASAYSLTRQGNYCILDIDLELTREQCEYLSNSYDQPELKIGTVSSDFYPKSQIQMSTFVGEIEYGIDSSHYFRCKVGCWFEIRTNGEIWLWNLGTGQEGLTRRFFHSFSDVKMGYEANPIV